MVEEFSLKELIENNEIKGLIFDKFSQKDHFRLFPYNQRIYGAFEAYILVHGIDVRHTTKKLSNLALTSKDEGVLVYAFLNKDKLGIPDGMGDIDEQPFINTLSRASKTDNFIFSNETLLNIYKNLDSSKKVKLPLPDELFRQLKANMSFCFFDKVALSGKGSICYHCAKILRKEGFIVPIKIIGRIKK